MQLQLLTENAMIWITLTKRSYKLRVADTKKNNKILLIEYKQFSSSI